MCKIKDGYVYGNNAKLYYTMSYSNNQLDKPLLFSFIVMLLIALHGFVNKNFSVNILKH